MRRLKRTGFFRLSPRRNAANATLLLEHSAPTHRADALAPLCASQYAFNLFSHTTKIGENGYNEEEMKMVKETRKIWGVRALTAQLRSAQGLCVLQSGVACALGAWHASA